MNRGDVWWADLAPPANRRLVVLIAREEALRARDQVLVVEVTTRIRGIPSEVRLGPEDGMPRACVANADVIHTIYKRDLGRYITTLTPERLGEMDDAIHFALGLDHP